MDVIIFVLFMLGLCLTTVGFIIAINSHDWNLARDLFAFLSMVLGLTIITVSGLLDGVSKNKSVVEVSTEAESVIETQPESVANSVIKVALIQNYPEAEIISNEDDLQQGIFVYNKETYNFEVEDNVLFIKQDKKLVKYIYLN